MNLTEPDAKTDVDSIDQAIGARVRARRRSLSMSQSDLADRLGVSFQQVQKYERGANRISGSTLVTASRALQTTVSWLVGEEAHESAAPDEAFTALMTPGALEMLEAYRVIPRPRARQALLALAREMARGDDLPGGL
ncbi:helix-turn-helix domain-containing protein [Phenylobacterium sp.]|uniref:helix-turn-helix domain-containing protein n=1 Tax=Phenylobacterium sp. TaxID=1871053 RepID=UPI00272F6A01|nr:helix-turn-helix domain-containing protein [Phenylobacterium sp.]MDP1872853.1 helix-turn-helix domain-containing protein [Phenylobacterium sp.]MDP3490189.1 helix-turn-helix domain-containing protein [Phenylobacterium sp.]